MQTQSARLRIGREVMTNSPRNGHSHVDHFESEGVKVRIETFPANAAGRASVILLHGANGIRLTNPVITGLTEFLGTHGLTVHVVHYFDRTQTAYADDDTIWQCFPRWLITLEDAILHVRRRYPERRIGLLGHSLGGFLSAAKAIRTPEVSALVVLSGGLDAESARSVEHAPPALILHGSSDSRVPLAEARRLEHALRAAGAEPLLHIYDGEGHTLQMPSYLNALQRVADFFRKHLIDA